MKALLLDADGVVLTKGELFSEKFAREHDVPLEKITPFFKQEYGDCQKGAKDLKEVLPPYPEQWGWGKGVDAFLAYWFEDFEINPDIERMIKGCQEKGIACYMASNNEHYRARAIEERLGDLLDGYFFSADLKVQKKSPEYFELIVNKLGVPAAEIGFTDNEEQNIEAAKEAGMNAVLYREGLFTEWTGPELPTEFKIR